MNDLLVNCLQCGCSLPPNTKRNFCNSHCYRKYRYHKQKPQRFCLYCKHLIKNTGYKYCSPRHRKYFEKLLRARQKVKKLVKNMNKARTGYKAEYKKIWGEKNHDKIISYNRNSYQKHRESRCNTQRTRYQNKKMQKSLIMIKNAVL